MLLNRQFPWFSYSCAGVGFSLTFDFVLKFFLFELSQRSFLILFWQWVMGVLLPHSLTS